MLTIAIAHMHPKIITLVSGIPRIFEKILWKEVIPPNTTNDNAVNIPTKEIRFVVTFLLFSSIPFLSPCSCSSKKLSTLSCIISSVFFKDNNCRLAKFK